MSDLDKEDKLLEGSFFSQTVEDLKAVQDDYLNDSVEAYRQYHLRPAHAADSDMALLDRQIALRETYAIARDEILKLNKRLVKKDEKIAELEKELGGYRHEDKYLDIESENIELKKKLAENSFNLKCYRKTLDNVGGWKEFESVTKDEWQLVKSLEKEA